MRPAIVAQPIALFRGEARAATLAVLASARNPLTAYRIAQIARKQRVKVNSELRAFFGMGLVSRAATLSGKPGWVLLDPDLRRYFQRTMRVSWSEDWLADRVDRANRNLAFLRRLERRPLDLTKFRGYKPPFAKEFRGRSETDRELAARRLRRSGRHSS